MAAAVPLGKAMTFRPEKNLCFLVSFASYEISIDHIPIIPLPGQHCVKFLLNFGHYGPFTFSVTGQKHAKHAGQDMQTRFH